MRGLSLVAASGGHSSSRCAALSLSRPLLLRSTGSRRAGSVVVAHRPSCGSAACGILPDQGSNPCPLHWQADSQPLRHQGNPSCSVFLRDELPTGIGHVCPHLLPLSALQVLPELPIPLKKTPLDVRKLSFSLNNMPGFFSFENFDVCSYYTCVEIMGQLFQAA